MLHLTTARHRRNPGANRRSRTFSVPGASSSEFMEASISCHSSGAGRGLQNARECLSPTPITTERPLPHDLKGVWYGMGPGVFRVGYQRQGDLEKETLYFVMNHFWDNIPLVQRIEFTGDPNTVIYNSRITAPQVLKKVRSNHGIPLSLFRHVFGTPRNQASLANLLFGTFFDGNSLSKKNPAVMTNDIYQEQKKQSESSALETGRQATAGKRTKSFSVLNLDSYGTNVAAQRLGALGSASELMWPFCLPGAFPGESDGIVALSNPSGDIQGLDPITLEPVLLASIAGIIKNSATSAKATACSPGAFQNARFAARPMMDEETKEWFFVALLPGYWKTDLQVLSIHVDEETSLPITETVVTIPNVPNTYIHSFALTPVYIIIVLFPLNVAWWGLRKNWGSTVLDTMSFNRQGQTLFHIISRQSKKLVATYQAAPCFALNVINAYEDEAGDAIVVDIITYDDHSILHNLTVRSYQVAMQPSSLDTIDGGSRISHKASRHGRPMPSSSLKRFSLKDLGNQIERFEKGQVVTLPTAAGETEYTAGGLSSMLTPSCGRSSSGTSPNHGSGWASPERLSAVLEQTLLRCDPPETPGFSLEFPVIHRKHKMKPYPFVWALGFAGEERSGRTPHIRTSIHGAAWANGPKPDATHSLFPSLQVSAQSMTHPLTDPSCSFLMPTVCRRSRGLFCLPTVAQARRAPAYSFRSDGSVRDSPCDDPSVSSLLKPLYTLENRKSSRYCIYNLTDLSNLADD